MAWGRWMLVLVVALGGLAACAPEIVRRPTQLTPMTEQPGGTIEVMEEMRYDSTFPFKYSARPAEVDHAA